MLCAATREIIENNWGKMIKLGSNETTPTKKWKAQIK